MIERIFLAHPRSVDESYGEHFSVAFGFGAQMVTGGLACIVHAFIPALFERTASKTVKSLLALWPHGNLADKKSRSHICRMAGNLNMKFDRVEGAGTYD